MGMTPTLTPPCDECGKPGGLKTSDHDSLCFPCFDRLFPYDVLDKAARDDAALDRILRMFVSGPPEKEPLEAFVGDDGFDVPPKSAQAVSLVWSLRSELEGLRKERDEARRMLAGARTERRVAWAEAEGLREALRFIVDNIPEGLQVTSTFPYGHDAANFYAALSQARKLIEEDK